MNFLPFFLIIYFCRNLKKQKEKKTTNINGRKLCFYIFSSLHNFKFQFSTSIRVYKNRFKSFLEIKLDNLKVIFRNELTARQEHLSSYRK